MSSTSDSRGELAERLKSARELAGLSQGQAAKILDMHRPTISEIEAGRRRVTAEELTTFARLYSVSAAWLAGEKPFSAPEADARLVLAARELARLKPKDLDKIMTLLAALRESGGSR